MNPTLSALFPNASKSCRDANPDVPATLIPKTNQNEPTVARKPKKRGLMNRTESEFALYLEALKRNGEILRYEFEGITLRWADMRYTPDFVVFGLAPQFQDEKLKEQSIKLIEIKGAHIHYAQQAIARFKGCRAFWPEFQFEMHQKTRNGWKKIL